MIDQQHPMVPPSILLKNWESDWFDERENVDVLLIQAYQAGADAELEACFDFVYDKYEKFAEKMQAARRPKPPSLKEQALAELERVDMLWDTDEFGQETLAALDIIRRALKALPNDN